MISKTYINKVNELISELIKSKYKLENINFIVDKNKDINNGDFFSNVCMVIVKQVKKNPLEIAEEVKGEFEKKGQNLVVDIKVANPGYLNFNISPKFKNEYFDYVLENKEETGQFEKKDIFYNIEFVSANPTGYLHIGHARNAALGKTLANIWSKYGIRVEKEYYINDAGNQINILGLSVFIRYLQLFNKSIDLPEDSYHGSEIIEIAKEIKNEHNDKFIDVEIVDNKISDEKVNDFFKNIALEKMLNIIKSDLAELRVNFDIFYSERNIYKSNLIDEALKKLDKYIYKKDNAIWLRTTDFNDDKDRVLVKSDGSYTYFLPDIAYHNIKLSRHKNISKIFNIWGADHKSYVDRVKIAIECLGYPKDIMETIIMQMVRLTQGGKEFKMSKRTGNSLTLRDLIKIIGTDSARWALVSQTTATQIEIDVDKFKAKTHDNNLYYVLYAYARICQLFNKISFIPSPKIDYDLNLLTHIREKELINYLIYFPCLIENISKIHEVNKLNNYLFQLVQVFHSYYNEINIKNEENKNLRNARCVLLATVMYTIKSGLKLLDIEPQEKI